MKVIQAEGLFFPFNGNTVINITKQNTNISINIFNDILRLNSSLEYDFNKENSEIIDRVYLCFLSIFQDFFSSENNFMEIPCDIFEDYEKDLELTKKTSIEIISYNKYSSKNLDWREAFSGLKLKNITCAMNPNICEEVFKEILKKVGLDIDKKFLTPEDCGKVEKFYETS